MTVRLLVVGGNGFIGRHLCAHAFGLGWEVTSLGLSGAGVAGTRVISADISDADALGQAIGNMSFDYVVNCGGVIDHANFHAGGCHMIDSHFIGVVNLVRLLDLTSLKRFVNIGSSDEYGAMPAPQAESMREAPISPYSLAKVAATQFLQMLYRTEGFPAVTLRLFLAYGPGQDQRRFLPQIIRGCLDGRSFPVSGGEQLRDFCYIDDTVRAVFATLFTNAADGEVINIGSGCPISIRSMIELVRMIVGKGEPKFGQIPYRQGENMALYAENEKAAKLLQWKPTVELREGLLKTINWFRIQDE